MRGCFSTVGRNYGERGNQTRQAVGTMNSMSNQVPADCDIWSLCEISSQDGKKPFYVLCTGSRQQLLRTAGNERRKSLIKPAVFDAVSLEGQTADNFRVREVLSR